VPRAVVELTRRMETPIHLHTPEPSEVWRRSTYRKLFAFLILLTLFAFRRVNEQVVRFQTNDIYSSIYILLVPLILASPLASPLSIPTIYVKEVS
jgi:hypothetical protein